LTVACADKARTARHRAKYLEALQQIASDADKLVFMPYEASG